MEQLIVVDVAHNNNFIDLREAEMVLIPIVQIILIRLIYDKFSTKTRIQI